MISQPAATAYVVEEGRTYGMGAVMALFMTAMQTGSSIGPVAIGGVIDAFGIDAGFYTGSLMIMLGAAGGLIATLQTNRGNVVRDVLYLGDAACPREKAGGA